MRTIALLVVLAAAGCNKEEPTPPPPAPVARPTAGAQATAEPARAAKAPAADRPGVPDSQQPAATASPSAPQPADATVDELAKLSVAYLGHSMRTLSAMEAALDPRDCASGTRARTALEAEYDKSAAMFAAVKKARAAATEQQRTAADKKSVAALGAQLQAMEAGGEARTATMRAFYTACPVESKALSREGARFSEISDL